MLSFTKNIVQLVQNLWTIQVCECFVGGWVPWLATTNMIKILSRVRGRPSGSGLAQAAQ